MSDPEERELLEDYLHRKSALSLGYKKIYVEAPPPELDRAITARARRALRWVVPALVAVGIAIGLGFALNAGVGKFMGALVSADRHNKQVAAERAASEPVSVDIVMPSLDAPQATTLSRDQWRAKIKALRASGKIKEADAEQAKFDQAFEKSK